MWCVRIIVPVVNFITEKTENEWDDDLLNEMVLRAFSQLIPAILVAILLPGSLNLGEAVYEWTVKLTKIYTLGSHTFDNRLSPRSAECIG